MQMRFCHCVRFFSYQLHASPYTRRHDTFDWHCARKESNKLYANLISFGSVIKTVNDTDYRHTRSSRTEVDVSENRTRHRLMRCEFVIKCSIKCKLLLILAHSAHVHCLADQSQCSRMPVRLIFSNHPFAFDS